MTNISEEKKAEITSELKGKNLMDLMRNPFGSVRDGALFCFEMISMTMANAAGMPPEMSRTPSIWG
jgi:hypothetical protein